MTPGEPSSAEATPRAADATPDAAAPDTLLEDWIGAKLGASPYRLVRALGSSKLAEVFLGEEMHKGGKVIVKIPHAALFQNEQFASRFHNEIQLLKKLQHPHLLPLLDQSEHQGRAFLVFPYCEAGNLKLRMTGPAGQLTARPPENLASWLLHIAQALDYLHENGLVHRDVKPSNILFDEAGKALLADVSLTRAVFNPLRLSMTRLDGMSFGTPRYMAPELLGRQVVDGRADQFSLAMIVWEWLTGRSLFKAESAAEVMAIHNVVLSFLPPWLPGPWKGVLKRGLARKPEDRYRTCVEFAREMLLRVDEGGATGEEGPENFDLECPEPTPQPAAAPMASPPARTVVTTQLDRVSTRLDPEETHFDFRRLEVDNGTLDLRRALAAVEKAHDELTAWFVAYNATNFPIPFETRARTWTGAWSPWARHTVEPGQSLPVFCHGAIGIEMRYNFRLSGGLENDHATLCPQLWPASARPRKEQVDSRYRFVIQDNRILLEFPHAPLAS